MTHYILDARSATAHFPGIGRYVRNLTAAATQLLHRDEHLTILWNPSDTTAWDPSPLAGDQVAILAVPVSPFDLRQQWRIPLLLKRRTAAAVYHSPYYLMPYCPGLPTLLTFYDAIPLRHPQTGSRRARLFFRLAMDLSLRATKQIVTISEAAKEDLIRYFPVARGKIHAIPLSADPRFQPQPSREIARVQRKYGLPQQFVFYLGINKPHKNLPALIQAYAQLPPPTRPPLVIAGAWDTRYPQPKQRAAQLHCADVRFLGPVDETDLPALYAAATLFVFPSLYEGFGLPVLEAMACGTPVACSNTSSLPEIAGTACRLFDPHSVAEIKEAIDELLADGSLRSQLADRGLAQAGCFSWQRTAAETLHCYRHTAITGHKVS